MIEMQKSHKCSSDEIRNRTRMMQDFFLKKIQISQPEKLHSGIEFFET